MIILCHSLFNPSSDVICGSIVAWKPYTSKEKLLFYKYACHTALQEKPQCAVVGTVLGAHSPSEREREREREALRYDLTISVWA